jgi:hypothetical protein
MTSDDAEDDTGDGIHDDNPEPGKLRHHKSIGREPVLPVPRSHPLDLLGRETAQSLGLAQP